MPTHPLNFLRAGAAAGLLVCLPACHEDPVREPLDTGMTLGGDVYRILCKRVASTAHPEDLTGTQFNAACEGMTDPASEPSPKLKAMLEMRESVVAALDVSLGETADPAMAASENAPETFAEDELTAFLELMVPLYDPPEEILPQATRTLAGVMRTWLDPQNTDSAEAIAAISNLSGREGFRPLNRSLGPIRLLLDYERLDQVTLSTLKLLDKGGPAHEPFLDALTGLGLELATMGDDDEDEPGKTGLEVAIELLTSTDPRLASNEGPLPVLKRDARGLPVPAAGMGVDADGDGLPDVYMDGTQPERSGRLASAAGGALPTPYRLSMSPNASIPDDTAAARDSYGRALTAPAEQGGQPVYDSWDMDQSLLAALLRDTGDLINRDGEPRSAVENLTRGLRTMLGPQARQVEVFGTRSVEFEGPDPAQSPMLELMHAVGSLLTLDETAQGLKMLQWLMEPEQEGTAAELMHVALRIDEISDDPMYDSAQLMGSTGEPGSKTFSPDLPHDFWDDLIQVVRDIDARPGMLEAVLRTFTDPTAPANVKIIANWMRHNNMVVWGGAPEDARPAVHPPDPEELLQNTINNPSTILEGFEPGTSPTVATYNGFVDPAMPNRGWNRSLWQRTLSLIHGLNGVPVCNKQDAYLKATALVELTLSPPQGEGPYDECAFINIQDAVQQYNQAVLGEAQIVFEPSDSADWVNTWAGLGSSLGISGTVGEEQEKDSGIYGFTDQPTAESLARFIFAPRNEFLQLLFDPLETNDGVPIAEWEPYALFPMEVVDPTAQAADGSTPDGMSFISSGQALVAAFENNELTDSEGRLTDGYMFGKMLSAVHMHWGAPNTEPCTEADWGCTQSQYPEQQFFAYGTNVRSYEPLIAASLLEEGLADTLYRNTTLLQSYTDPDTGEDGITVLLKLIRALINPKPDSDESDGIDDSIHYRGGSPAVSKTNTGEELDGVLPIYLVFDAVKKLEEAWEQEPEREEAWLAARSKLVDLFLGASEVTDPNDGSITYQMTNRNIPPVTKLLVDWLLERIQFHKDQGDLATWGPELADDVEDILAHPAAAAGLDMLDVFWDDQAASDEVAGLLTYLLGDPEREDFSAMLETVLHAAQFLRDEDRAEDLAHGLALLLEPTGQSNNAQEMPTPAESTTMKGLTMLVRLVERDLAEAQAMGRPSTTGNKILRNTVKPLAGDGRSPLEVFIDAVFRLHRTDPTRKAYGHFSQDDVRKILTEAAEFLDDERHGLERLAQVVQNRQLGDGDEAAPTGGGSATTGNMGTTGMTGTTTGGTAGATAGTAGTTADGGATGGTTTGGTAGTTTGGTDGTTTGGTAGTTGATTGTSGMTAGATGMTAGSTGMTSGTTAGTTGGTTDGTTDGTTGDTAGDTAGATTGP